MVHPTFKHAIALASIAFGLWLASRPTRAIPAFARSHGLDCAACHAPPPRLNAAGERFASSGFRIEAIDGRRDRPEIEGDFASRLPLALRADFGFQVQSAGEGSAFDDFSAPLGVWLLGAGQLADGLSAGLSFRLDRASSEGLEEAWLRFDDLLGSGLELTVGQIQITRPIFRPKHRLSFQPYEMLAVRPGLSLADPAYDRGIQLAYRFSFGLDVTAAVLNGNGRYLQDIGADLDIDKYKSYLLALGQELGPVRVGLFGYWGKEERDWTLGEDGLAVQIGTPRPNEVLLWGPDLLLSLGRADIRAQYLMRRDLNPCFEARNPEHALLTHGVIIEALASLLGDPPELFLVMLFNYTDSEAIDSDSRPIREVSFTANLAYLLWQNVRLVGEYGFSPYRRGEITNDHRAILGLVSGW
ncbi:MAG: hypothetical protein JXR96_01105 [Deltaproteobacteria bacterium]|nr:hypothetical protein [Deltaproteobacteria bacterium]